MNTIERMIADSLGIEDREKRRRITIECFRYLLKATKAGKDFTATQLRQAIRIIAGENENIRQFVLDLTYGDNCGYILRHIKPWLWWGIKKGSINPAIFGVKRKDSELVYVARHLEKDCKALLKYKAISAENLEKAVDESKKEMREYARKFAGKRLRFMKDSAWEKTTHDFAMELYSLALRDVFVQYPKIDTKAHFVNIMKQSVSRRGVNLIRDHIRSGKAIVGDGEETKFGGESREVDEWMQKTISIDEVDEDTISIDEDEVNDSKATMHTIMASVGKDKEDAVIILAGLWHEGFSEHLGEDNTDLFARSMMAGSGAKYMRECSKYTGLSKKELEALVSEIRELV